MAAMVTGFDCWHPEHDHVNVGDVIRVMHARSSNAKELLRHAIPRLDAVAGRVLHKGGSSWIVSSS